MSMEVRAITYVSPTCLKVLSEQILCTERYYFELSFSVCLCSLRLSHILYVFSPKLSIKHVFGFLFLYNFCTPHFYMVSERDG